MRRRRVVAVIGNAACSSEQEAAARALGGGIVDRGWRVVSGGLGGVMEAVSRGARESKSWREGDVVGIIPGSDSSAASEFVDIVVPTGMGFARNVLVAQTGDAVVAIGGGSGTLSEIALAWQFGKPIVALASPGWSDRLGGQPLDDRREDAIERALDVDAALVILERVLR